MGWFQIMSLDDSGQCKICGGWNCNAAMYVENGAYIKCNFLKGLITEIVMLKQSNNDLEIKTLTKNDMNELFISLDQNLNVSPYYDQKISYLQRSLQHKNLSVENRHFIFQRAITNKYPFLVEGQFTNIINENMSDFINFLKHNMDDEEENTLIEFIKCRAHKIFYALTLFFRLDRPKLSEFLEEIMYETIIERHVPGQIAHFTSGNWSVYRVVEEYKNANLGKALLTIKKITSPVYINYEIANFIKRYPEATKYGMLV